MRYIYGCIAFLAVFAGLSLLLVYSEQSGSREKFLRHAAIIAEDVWALNESNSRSYLTLALTRDHYRSISIVENDGRIFLQVEDRALKGIDTLLHSCGLLPLRSHSAAIAYNGKTIAQLAGEQYIRVFYPIFNLLIFLLFLSLAVFFFVLLFQKRGQLQKQVEERTKHLRESENRFHDLVNLLPEMVWETDSRGYVTYANKMAHARFGFRGDQAGEETVWDSVIVPQEQEKANRYFEKVVHHEQVGLVELSSRDGEGTTFPLLLRSAPIIQDGKITGARFIGVDITERQRLEEKLKRAERMRAIGLMAGGVAHDLNNILSGVVTYPEVLLLDLPEDSHLRPPIEAIRKSGLAAADVVTDLLTVARGVASSKTVKDVREIVSEYLTSPEYLRLINLYPEVDVTTALSKKKLLVNCSPTHLRKCLMNLVTNGAEAISGEGTVEIAVGSVELDTEAALEKGVKEGCYVTLSVNDTGGGIADDDIEHIFEPFYTKKVLGRSGTGLGLTVVWNTVREHDGVVHVTSSAEGTRFTLYFPEIDPQFEQESNKDESMDDFRGKGEHILVVDDEWQQCQIARSVLVSLGYSVHCVNSGEEAVNYCREAAVDLVVLDMIMGAGINGRETYERILQYKPNQKAIIVSGYSENEDVSRALALGAGGFVAKPYTVSQLGRSIYVELNNTAVIN